MWFRKDLKTQISEMIRAIEASVFALPDDWQWMEKREHKLEGIEAQDIVLLKELKELHSKGLDIPDLSLRIVTKAERLMDLIRVMESQAPLDPKTQKDELSRLRSLTAEIDAIFRQELEYLRASREFESRGEAVPSKCRAYFLADANKAENSGLDFSAFLGKVGRDPDPSNLYSFLRRRYSGFVGSDALSKEYRSGQKKFVVDKLRSELRIVETDVPKVLGVKYVSGQGWNHFILNGDSQRQRSFKAYVTFDYEKFSAKAFIAAVQALVKSGFRGQIKIAEPQMVYTLFQQDDNIVIHGGEDVARAAQIVIKILEQNGVRMGGGSRGGKYNMAEDFMVPELKHLGKPAHKTSFSLGVAELACESLLGAIAGSRQYLNSYDDFRKFVTKLFAADGPFDKYLKSANLG